MCVGYPMISILGQRAISEEKAAWYSNIVAESVFTFGKVSIPTFAKICFIRDLSIAPGNSGGPVLYLLLQEMIDKDNRKPENGPLKIRCSPRLAYYLYNSRNFVIGAGKYLVVDKCVISSEPNYLR